jgi:RNA polymerase sigma-70 factor (ECF subfamily)
MKQPDGSHRAFQLQVLTLTSKGVSHVSTFFDTTLFEQFGLSEVLVRGTSAPAALTSDA